ncbi:MAG: hypothetical protein HY744_14890 [Deltaproteobacteria bacterium]|nr:hypothetical protein [Deltaproteobacteria bacterium]
MEEETTENGGHSSSSGSSGSSGTAGGAGMGGGAGTGGSGGQAPPACDPYVPRPQVPELIIGPSGLDAKLVAVMDAAQQELALSMYQLNWQKCIDGLVAAHGRGVNVRVQLDYEQSTNSKAKSQLKAAGIEVRDAPAEFEHFHAKVLIADGVQAVVMSANMNSYSMKSERNYGVIDRDPQDLAQLRAIFERDWAGSGPLDLDCTRLIVSPESSRERLIGFIAGAKKTLDMEMMYISDGDALGAIKGRQAAGVAVRVLLADPAWIDSNPETAAELASAGIAVKYLKSLELHAKLILADAVAFIGSQNLSWTSLEKNREVGLLVTEPGPAAEAADRFEKDWKMGVSP